MGFQTPRVGFLDRFFFNPKLGLRDPENGLRLQKRSEIWASDERLVAPLRKFVCDGKHQHSVIQGSFQGQNKSHVSRVWTLGFCSVGSLWCC